MSLRSYLILALLGMAVLVVLAAAFQTAPG